MLMSWSWFLSQRLLLIDTASDGFDSLLLWKEVRFVVAGHALNTVSQRQRKDSSGVAGVSDERLVVYYQQHAGA